MSNAWIGPKSLHFMGVASSNIKLWLEKPPKKGKVKQNKLVQKKVALPSCQGQDERG